MISLANLVKRRRARRGEVKVGAGTVRGLRYIAVVPLAYLVWAYVVGPLVGLLWLSIQASGDGLTLNPYLGAYPVIAGSARRGVGETALSTLGVAVVSVVLAGLVGTMLALLLHRFDLPGRRLLTLLAVLPVVLPPLTVTLGLGWLFARGGLVPRALGMLLDQGDGPSGLDGIPGVLLVHTYTLSPVFFLLVTVALGRLDPFLMEAGRSLGAGQLYVWRRVLLPLLAPALLSATLLALILAVGSLAAPSLFRSERTLTVQIVQARHDGNLPFAAAHATVLAAVSVGLYLPLWRHLTRPGVQPAATGHHWRCAARRPGARVLARLGALLLAGVLLLPILGLALTSLTQNDSPIASGPSSSLTLQQYGALLSDSALWQPVQQSLLLSTSVAVAASIVAAGILPVRWLLPRGWRRVLDVFVLLPLALPGTVVGLALLTTYDPPSMPGFEATLAGTVWLVLLAQVVLFSPLLLCLGTASLARRDPMLEEAARTLGASWWYACRRVTLPPMIRTTLGGMLLVFALSLGEFNASVLVATPAGQSLSLEILTRATSRQAGLAAVYGTIQTVLIVVSALLAWRLLPGDLLVAVPAPRSNPGNVDAANERAASWRSHG